MTPEYRTIQRNTSGINDGIANQANPSLFADKLVDDGFISKQAANNIMQVAAFSNYDKVSRLMQAVDSKIRTASNPTTTFETFIGILRVPGLSLDELADKLVKFYRQLNPGYRGPLCSQGGGGPAPSSTSLQQKLGKMELNEGNILNVLQKADFSDADWEFLGQQLKIKQANLSTIRANRHHQASLCMIDMISKWLRADTEASWEKLAAAVAEMENYGEATADNVRRKAGIGGQKRKANEGEDVPENKQPRSEEGPAPQGRMATDSESDPESRPAPQGRMATDSGEEKPLYDNKYGEEILSKHRPIHCTSSDEFRTIEDFAQKVEIVIQSCNKNEYYASLELMKAPEIPKPDGQSQLFEKAVRFPNKIDMKIALGMFAGHKAAIAWTEQGASCESDIRKVLSWFPNTKALLGVGVAYGMERGAVKFCDVLVASQIADFGSQPRAQGGRIYARGEFVNTKTTLKNIFCKDDAQWEFLCTEKRPAKVVVGQLVSGAFLLDDLKMKQSIQEQCKFAKGGEMEGWILYTHILKEHPNLEAIIIKGVADYADGEKDKRWQLTAAMAAASYTHFQLKQSTALRAVTAPQPSSPEQEQDTEKRPAVTAPQPSSPEEEQDAEKSPGVKNTQPSEKEQSVKNAQSPETEQSNGKETGEQQLERMANTLTVDDIAEFLKKIKLGQHVELFTDNDVDGRLLLKLTDDDLKDLGVDNGFHRRKIITKFEAHILELINKQEQ